MRHLGDITKISGYTAPIVDCVIGGSPCQGLSQAGLREGLDDERSGLYIEQTRIVKEMREQDERNGRTGVDIRPRYMVWENVPGAFSSNKGEDFRIVLEELAKIADKDAVIPMPPKEKWTTCGCIMGDGWSIAWRVLDAQFWGVPQRRRRIALVADFGGQSAPEILFVRESVSGHTDESKPKRKAVASDASRGIRADDCIGVDIYNTALTGGKACPLTAEGYTSTGTCPKVLLLDNQGGQQISVRTDGKCPTLRAESHGNIPCAITFEPGIAAREGGHIYEGVSGTLRANAGDNQMATAYRHCLGFHLLQDPISSEKASPCFGGGNSLNGQASVGVVYALDRASYNQGKNAQYDFEVSDKGINSPLVAKGPGAVCYEQKTLYIVRRLTPLECERLQDYPDGWTDIGEWTDSNGKKRQTSDAARYKALGNSIALPPWKWVLKRICACYERDATMASLFDGIGGFPYLWEQLNGKGTCLWASEIEEFPMAVTKVRIGE